MQDINLLPKNEFERISAKKRGFYWITKYGRVIVISFQAIVITLLFYKLYLHTNLVRLTETIDTQIETIKLQNQTEVEIRDIQQRILLLKKVQENSFEPSNYINLIKTQVPSDIEITTLIIEKGLIKFSARSKNLFAFGQMLGNLSLENSIENTTLLGAQFNKETNEFIFNVQISIKNL
ncbi:MAG: hypothetical protein ABIB98_00185 [bacterium]